MMFRTKIAFAVLACSMSLTALAQQTVTPRTMYIYPAGGQRGTTFEALIGGQNLNNLNNVRITGDGIRIAVIEDLKPFGQDQQTVREQFRDLMKKWALTHPEQNPNRFANQPANQKPAEWSESDEQQARLLRIKIRQFQLRRTNPAISELVRVKVTISPNASLGLHEIRLETGLGLTAPLNFFVGTLPEWSKPAADIFKDEPVSMDRAMRLRNDNPPSPPPTPTVNVSLPVLINGQIMPGGVDSYSFKVHKGEHLVAAVNARQITPYIADAVPGWFQPSITLYDAKGKQIQTADHYTFHPDPVLLVDIPEDGEYTLKIHDSIYRGREDFVYRIAVGELPFVTGIFPLGGKAGGKTKIEFTGWNLPQNKITEQSRDKARGVEMITLGDSEFNRRPFMLDTLPEVTSKSGNHTRSSAQKISVPTVVNGRILEKGQANYFQFKGSAGQEIEAEVYARRLGSPLDSVLVLMDANGKTLTSNDDFTDEGSGLLTDQADSLISYKLPADGVYILCLRDTLKQGGPEFAYRLRINAPQPDFDLHVAPSNINIRPGEVVPLTVLAQRHGGFKGDILLKLKNAPLGLQLNAAVVPGNQSCIRITMSAAPNTEARVPSPITIEGFAKIGGKDVHRASSPAEDETQAFFYHHLVSTNDVLVTVRGQRQQQPWILSMDHPLILIANRTIPVRIHIPPRIAGNVKITLSDPPEGITIERTTPEGKDSIIAYLKADGKHAPAGFRSNLLFLATSERPPRPNSKGKPVSVTELMPALPVEVFASMPHPAAGSTKTVSSTQGSH